MFFVFVSIGVDVFRFYTIPVNDGAKIVYKRFRNRLNNHPIRLITKLGHPDNLPRRLKREWCRDLLSEIDFELTESQLIDAGGRGWFLSTKPHDPLT